MPDGRLNRVSTIGLFVLSLSALSLVLWAVSRILITGVVPPPPEDEGAAARVFQLLVAAMLPTGLVFLVTSDWARPLRVVGRLAIPVAAVLVSLGLIYYFEHGYGAL